MSSFWYFSSFRYPFACADILSSDTPAIVSAFFKTKEDASVKDKSTEASETSTDDEVNVEEVVEKEKSQSYEQKDFEREQSISNIDFTFLDYLFDFLDQKSINLTSAGYLAKIISNLHAKRTTQVILSDK